MAVEGEGISGHCVNSILPSFSVFGGRCLSLVTIHAEFHTVLCLLGQVFLGAVLLLRGWFPPPATCVCQRSW